MNTSFQDFNRNLIKDLRAHGKATSGPFEGREVLILTTKGAKSGDARENPLVYTRDGDHYVIVASKGGADTHPGWYRNLLANPQAMIEVDDETVPVVATEIKEVERRRLYDAHAQTHPGFKDYELKTSREIPVFILKRAG